ncbi:hypothetical protein BTO30_01470 [Domibacillus antri]|uniref:BIG2 domain-containing protein n=1 Tax=Domibacillus antri TaxID=1714264 RepID=A0A1Q8Q9U6_9BACI|nr:S8 family serine peptidase [Domibacillus antri]OLN24110.1 hypothetical protein BTO30_01470 [Domibacillus antri]
MSVLKLVKCVLAVFLVLGSLNLISAEGAANDAKTREREDKLAQEKEKQILIQYKESSKKSEYAAKKKLYSASISAIEPIAPLTEVITVKDKKNVDALIKELKKDNSVQIVEKNRISHVSALTNDPYISSQWWLDTVNAVPAWPHTDQQRKQIVTAVIDSGLDTSHVDLKNKIARGGYDFYSGTAVMSDPNGHGTKVSGVMAAEANNAAGIAGVTGEFDVKILPLRVANYEGESYVSDVIEAIDYAISMNVDVINISLGSDSSSSLENAAIQRAADAGIIIVASAGNEALEGNPILYPASYENVISVGAVDQYKNRSSFSNYNSYVDVTAPGEEVYTTAPYQSYEYVNGTSFSAPIAAGILSIAKALKPELTVDEASDLIETTADDLGTAGYDIQYGHGLVNAGRVVTTLLADSAASVTGVQLDKSTVNMSFSSPTSSASNTAETKKQQMNEATKTKTAIMDETRLVNELDLYESEPNDDTSSANNISLNSYLSGSITDYYFDTDYYRFTVDQPGTFTIDAAWVSGYVAGYGYEDDLEVVLLDENGDIMTYADYQPFSDGTASRFMSRHIDAGTYYITVFQSSDYQSLYTDEWYGISAMFEADQSSEQPAPVISLTTDTLFLKKGQSDSLLQAGNSITAIQWSSSNPAAAAVDQNGNVTGTGYGKAVISAAANGKTIQCVVKVTADTVNPTAALFETVLPADARNKNVTWKSSNPSVATVDQYGIITAKGQGTAVITVITDEGNFRASSTVNVTGSKTTWTDFSAKDVKTDKVFTVQFNFPVDPQSVNSTNIYVAADKDGINRIPEAQVYVNAENNQLIHIAPGISWPPGTYYLFVTNQLKSTDGKTHNKNIRMPFTVTN